MKACNIRKALEQGMTAEDYLKIQAAGDLTIRVKSEDDDTWKMLEQLGVSKFFVDEEKVVVEKK